MALTKEEILEREKDYKEFLIYHKEGILIQKEIAKKMKISPSKVARFAKYFRETQKNEIVIRSKEDEPSWLEKHNERQELQINAQKKAVLDVLALKKKEKEDRLFVRIRNMKIQGFNDYTISKSLDISLNKVKEILGGNK